MSRPALDWGDPIAVSKWLGALRVTIGDAQAVARDMLRPMRKRELGPALHRDRYRDTGRQIREMLDYASAPEPDGDEPGGATTH